MIKAVVLVSALVAIHFQHVPVEWAKNLHNKNGVNCCTDAEAATVKDPDWGVENGVYWVFIQGERVNVPPNAVIEEPNKTNMALVWLVWAYNKPHVKCFMPGYLS